MRALGSMGRSEPCPFSDLEFMILIENEEHKPYFQKLAQLLEFQVVSLGETNTGTHPVFTCLGSKHTSGFHFDTGANPLSRPDLMETPQKLDALQLQPVDTNAEDVPTAPPNQVLKSGRLLKNENSTLFTEYREDMESILDSGDQSLRHARALQLFETRSIDFQKVWSTPILSNPINIKKQYVELLNFFLADMALYFGIRASNTLDIIEALVEKSVFTKNTGDLLKEAIASIYCLRVRLHQFYGEQKEEGYLTGLSGCQLKKMEIGQLDKIYWLILRPLYHFCLPQVMIEKKSVEVVFSDLDLVSVCLDEVCESQGDPGFFIPLIKHIAEGLFATHLDIFKKLSKRSELEPLRQAYLEVLEINQIPEALLGQIRAIPNRAGFRRSFLKKENDLKDKIEAISTPDFHNDKTTSQARLISSRGIRYLKPEIIREILDDSGDLIDSYPESTHAHSVAKSLAGLHFKQKPTHPLMEYAIHNLFFRLCGDLTPPTELVRLEVDGEKPYPVLISATVQGITLKKRLENPLELEKPQWARWTWMLLCSILTRPGDGRTSNYLLDFEDNIFCIDNDISFVVPVVKKSFSCQIHFCSALFCLFQDRPLDPSVLEEFCSLDVDAILLSWIDDVIQKEGEYLSLFTEEERTYLYQEDPNNRFKATILFREGTLAILNTQFVYLQNQLYSLLQQNKTLTPIELLKCIISLSDSSIPTLFRDISL